MPRKCVVPSSKSGYKSTASKGSVTTFGWPSDQSRLDDWIKRIPRFGMYRQLSGGCYHVMVAQVLEAEKKIRVSKLLTLQSSSFGTVQINALTLNTAFDEGVAATPKREFAYFCDVIDESINTSTEFECDVQSLICVSGYVCFKICGIVQCMQCRDYLRMDKMLSIDNDIDMFVSDLSFTRFVGQGWIALTIA